MVSSKSVLSFHIKGFSMFIPLYGSSDSSDSSSSSSSSTSTSTSDISFILEDSDLSMLFVFESLFHSLELSDFLSLFFLFHGFSSSSSDFFTTFDISSFLFLCFFEDLDFFFSVSISYVTISSKFSTFSCDILNCLLSVLIVKISY